MSTERVLHQAIDSEGNSIPILGWFFGIKFDKNIFNIQEIIDEANELGIPKEYFTEEAKKTSFKKAVTKDLGKDMGDGFIIHEVSSTSEKIVYSVDKKKFTSSDKTLFDSDTNQQTTVSTVDVSYENIGSFMYICGDDRILCHDQEVLSNIHDLIKKYQANYVRATLSMKIRNILKGEAKIVPFANAGHTYFVPCTYKEIFFNLKKLVARLDPDAVFTISEVADLQYSCQTIADSASSGITSEVEKIMDGIEKIYTNPDSNIGTKAMNSVDKKLVGYIDMLEEYKVLTKCKLTELESTLIAASKDVLELQMTGKVKKWEDTMIAKAKSEMVEENNVDEDLLDL